MVREITAKSMSSTQALEYFISYVHLENSGFYYFLSAIHLLTGVPPDAMMRFGGPVLGGLVSFSVYILLGRWAGSFGALLGAGMLFLSPMTNRFVSPLRENFGYLLLLCFLFLVERRSSGSEDGKVRGVYAAVLGLLLAASIIVHLLTPMILHFVFIVKVLDQYMNAEKGGLRESALILITSLGLAILYSPMLLETWGWLLGLVSQEGTMLLVIPFGLGAGLTVVSVARKRGYRLTGSIKILILLFSFTVILFNVYFPPDLGVSYSYQYISQTCSRVSC